MAGFPFHIRWRNQQGAGYLGQRTAVGAGRPGGDGDAAQAVGDQHHAAGLAADFAVEFGDPVGTLRGDPVLLLHPRGVWQGALPVALPMGVVGSVPARHDQVADAVVAHGAALSNRHEKAF